MLTKNGHSMFDISSLLQKSIRRCDPINAGYAANELLGRYRGYLWKRLLTISAEDCWGIVTAEIVGLQKADEIVNAKAKGYDINPLFIAKAVTLLLKASKNRDADYFACNLLNSNKTLPDEELKSFLVNASARFRGIPQYTYDCHTRQGRSMGKTKQDMILSEQACLKPHQVGDFDNESWDNFFKYEAEGFDLEKGFPLPDPKDVHDVTHGIEKLF